MRKASANPSPNPGGGPDSCLLPVDDAPRLVLGGVLAATGQLTATMLGVDPVATCVAAYNRGEKPDRVSEKTAVKLLTQLLVAKAPGNSVEVRVPPYSAVQILEGVRHRRGTPPATVECTAQVFIELATGALTWAAAKEAGQVVASGQRSDLSDLLPLVPMPPV